MDVISYSMNTFWKGEFGVTGSVLDGEKQYSVSLKKRGSQIIGYSCSCGNKQLCEHGKVLDEQFMKQEQRGRVRPVMTSQEIRSMVREYTSYQVSKIRMEEEMEPVRFIPSMNLLRNQLEVEFKIGREKLYPVKDFYLFVKMFEQGSYYEYGRNFGCYHGYHCFYGKNRELVSFLIHQVHLHKESVEKIAKKSYESSSHFHKLEIQKHGMDEFFSLMQDETFEVETLSGEHKSIRVKRENPFLQIEIRPFFMDGMEVFLRNEVFCFFGKKGMYVLQDDTLYCCDTTFIDCMEIFIRQLSSKFLLDKKLEVHSKDIPLFIERVVQFITPYCEIHTNGMNLDEYRPVPLKVEFRFDAPNLHEIHMVPSLSYADVTFHPLEDGRLPKQICRDVPGEFRVSRVITKYFQYKEEDPSVLIIRNDEDGIYRLLSQGMEAFYQIGQVYLSEAFAKLKVRPLPPISFGIQSRENWLELEIETTDLDRKEFLQILDGYEEKKSYYRLKSGEYIVLDERRFSTISQLIEDVGIRSSDLRNDKIQIPLYRTFYLEQALKAQKDILFIKDVSFQEMSTKMGSFSDNNFVIPSSLESILRPYQKVGFCWLKTLENYGFGGILADDMGLGKTIQIITLLQDYVEREPKGLSLILCPASLVYNWEHELKRFAKGIRTLIVAGKTKERLEQLEHATEYQVLVTSYDLLKRDLKAYESLSFQYQIADEAHMIKNASTQSSKAVKSIKSKVRFALTGTPVENHLGELWNIFDFLMPGFLFSYPVFKKRYEMPIVRDGSTQCMSRLHQMIAPFLLRRMKEDVLKELPKKQEQIVYVLMGETQRKLYDARALRFKEALASSGEELDASERMMVLKELMRLRQLCCDPRLVYEDKNHESAKLEACVDIVKSGISAGHKILLFSQFTSMLHLIEERLEKEGIECYLLCGSTPKVQRMQMVTAFQEGKTPIFLISLKAGGTGLNLTAADMVIHYDPWWNMAAQNQATDRAHRIGQRKQVSVIKFVAKSTIEENILKLQEIKQKLADEIVSSDRNRVLTTFTKEEIMKLL